MAVTNRLRSVPPSMARDEVLIELDPEIRATGLLLHLYVDDHGRGSANPLMIRSQLYPLTPEITDEVIEWHITVLEDVGYIRTYKDDRKKLLLQVVEWPSQDRAQPSRLPAPPDDPPPSPDASRAAREPLATSSRAARDDLAVVEEREKRGERASGESGSAEESAAARARALLVGKTEPSPFCKKHIPTLGTDDKCMPCGRARLAHKEWVKAQVEAAELEEREAP
jgi:hypothetical protein